MVCLAFRLYPGQADEMFDKQGSIPSPSQEWICPPNGHALGQR